MTFYLLLNFVFYFFCNLACKDKSSLMIVEIMVTQMLR